MDDALCSSLRTTYNNEESKLPRVRRVVLEYLIKLDVLLANIERAGTTISGEKFDIYIEGVNIVSYYYDR